MNPLWKIFLPAACFGLMVHAHAQDPFTHEANNFLFSSGDFNNDSRQDLVIVDQTTGSIRLATQQATGSFTWGEAQSSGIESPEALSVGRFYLSTHDAIALGSTTANRIHLYGISNPAELFTPNVIFPSTPGPSSLAAFNVDNLGTADLVAIGEGLAPSANKGPATTYEAITSLNSSPTTTWTTSFSIATRRVNPVRPKTGVAPRMAEIFGAWTGSSSIFYLETVGPTGTSSAIGGGSIATASRYSVGSLDATTLTHILAWVPDQSNLRCQRVEELTPGAFTIGAAVNFNMGAPIRQVTPIQQVTSARIAVLFADGSVKIYQFNGSTAPVEVTTPHPSGADMILPVGTADLLIASGLRGPAPTWRRITQSGNAYVNASLGTMPAARPAAMTSNILFLSAEPFVNEGVTPTLLRQFREWTTSATSAGGIAWTVQSLGFTSSGTGLSGSQPVTLSSKAASDFPLLNQYSPALSIHSLDPRIGSELADILFDPPPGLYNTPSAPPTVSGAPAAAATPVVTVRISATEAGFTLYYRNSPTADYQLVPDDGEFPITSTTSFQVYGKSGTRRTPSRTATYTIGTPPQLTVPTAADSNNNGLTDAWEAAFNVTDPAADPDLDGYNNLEEAQAGGDPNIFGYLASLPPKLTGEMIPSGGSWIYRLEWAAGDSASVLQSSTTLGGWTSMGNTPTVVGNKKRVDVAPNIALTKRFFRLSR